MCEGLSGYFWATVALALMALGTYAQTLDPHIEATVEVSRSAMDPQPEITPGAVLRGTVSDENGAPLEGISVTYNFVHTRMGGNASNPVHTDADGRYELPLPWAAVEYTVRASARGNNYDDHRIQASAEQSLDFVLEPRVYKGPKREEHFVYGVVPDGKTGNVVPGAEVVQCGTGDAERRVTTDGKGEFVLSQNNGFYGSRIYARHNGLVSPITGASGHQESRLELLLGPPGSLAGVVTTEDDGLPAATCPIAIAAMLKQPALTIEGRTNEKGHYLLENVPPGEYLYVVNVPRRGAYEHRFSLMIQDKVTIAPGAPTRLNLRVEKLARLSGRVIGPSGEPANFALLSAQYVPLYSFSVDGEGRFSATIPKQSGNSKKSHPPILTAFHPSYGYGVSKIPDIGPGEEKDDVEIRLNGMTRLSGQLRDIQHKPVTGVKILETITDESGYFDSGLMPVPLDHEGFAVKMHPPRPRNNRSPLPHDDETGLESDQNPPYYYTPPFRVFPHSGEHVRLDIQLEEAPLRTFHGIVRDEAGQPSADIRVHLYAGMPTTSQWLKDISPRYPAIAQTMVGGPRPATLVARAVTDDQGRWRIQMVREVVREADRDMWHTDEYHADNIAIFTSDGQQRTMAMTATQIKSDYVDLEVPLVLRPAPVDLAMAVKVVDGEGQPIPDVAWVQSTFHGPYMTDADGLLFVPRLSKGVELMLLTKGYRIVAAEEAKAPPRGASSRTGGIPYIGTYYMPQIERAVEPSSSPFKVDDSFVRFPFVADDDVAVVITLESVEEENGAE